MHYPSRSPQFRTSATQVTRFRSEKSEPQEAQALQLSSRACT